MASGYSQPHDFGQYVSQLPLDTIEKGLAYKQGKYDRNRAKLQSFFNNFSSLDIIKDADREYFMKNLEFLRNEVEKFGMQDLSQNGVTEQIAQYVGHAGDEKVAKAVAGTRAYRKINSEADWYKQKKPELYSDMNLAFSLKGLNKWINDGKVGSDWTSSEYGETISNYVPFTDVIKKANEIVKEIEPEAFAYLTPRTDANGSYIFSFRKQNGEEVTSERIKTALESQLFSDPNVVRQIQVNGWGQFQGISDDRFSGMIRDNYQAEVDRIDGNIAELEKAKLTAPDSKKAQYQESIDYWKAQKKPYDDDLSLDPATWDQNIRKNRSTYESMLYKTELVDGIVASRAYKSIKDDTIVTDQGALSIWKEEQVNRRHQETLAQKERELSQKGTDQLLALAEYIDDGDTFQAQVLAERLAPGNGQALINEVVSGNVQFDREEANLPDLGVEDIANKLEERLAVAEDTYRSSMKELLTEMYTPDKLKSLGITDDNGEFVDTFPAIFHREVELQLKNGSYKNNSDVTGNQTAISNMYANLENVSDAFFTSQNLKEKYDEEEDKLIGESFTNFRKNNDIANKIANLTEGKSIDIPESYNFVELDRKDINLGFTVQRSSGLDQDLVVKYENGKYVIGYDITQTSGAGNFVQQNTGFQQRAVVNTPDEVVDELRKLYNPEEVRTEFTNQFVKNIFGGQLTNLGLDVSPDNSSKLIFSDVVSQLGNKLPEELQGYNSTSAIDQAVKDDEFGRYNFALNPLTNQIVLNQVEGDKSTPLATFSTEELANGTISKAFFDEGVATAQTKSENEILERSIFETIPKGSSDYKVVSYLDEMNDEDENTGEVTRTLMPIKAIKYMNIDGGIVRPILQVVVTDPNGVEIETKEINLENYVPSTSDKGSLLNAKEILSKIPDGVVEYNDGSVRYRSAVVENAIRDAFEK